MTGSVVRFCHPTLQVSVLENESCALRQRVEQQARAVTPCPTEAGDPYADP